MTLGDSGSSWGVEICGTVRKNLWSDGTIRIYMMRDTKKGVA